MTTTKWHYHAAPGRTNITVVDDNGVPIAIVHDASDVPKVAAAPALLEALEGLDTLMDFGDPLTPFTAMTYDDVTAINATFAAAKAAIKLARGDE